MWIKLTHSYSGKPMYINTRYIVSVWKHPDNDNTRVSTVEDAIPIQVKEDVETVMNLIKMAVPSEEQENA
jgi:hypothetical protein